MNAFRGQFELGHLWKSPQKRETWYSLNDTRSAKLNYVYGLKTERTKWTFITYFLTV